MATEAEIEAACIKSAENYGGSYLPDTQDTFMRECARKVYCSYALYEKAKSRYPKREVVASKWFNRDYCGYMNSRGRLITIPKEILFR